MNGKRKLLNKITEQWNTGKNKKKWRKRAAAAENGRSIY
jgi:hypothetical protein